MRKLGVAVLVIGLLAVFAAINMDVSVATGSGRVNNLGLMNQRQNLATLSGMFALGGLLMILFGVRREDARQKYESTYESKPCPFCAERIKKSAIKCKHCGSEISSTPQPTALPSDDGWTVRFDCEAWAYAEIAKKAKAMGLPIVKSPPTTVVTGPYPSELDAEATLATFKRIHGLPGYTHYAPKSD